MSDVDHQEQVNAVDQLNANWMVSVNHDAVPAPFREPPRNIQTQFQPAQTLSAKWVDFEQQISEPLSTRGVCYG